MLSIVKQWPRFVANYNINKMQCMHNILKYVIETDWIA